MQVQSFGNRAQRLTKYVCWIAGLSLLFFGLDVLFYGLYLYGAAQWDEGVALTLQSSNFAYIPEILALAGISTFVLGIHLLYDASRSPQESRPRVLP